MISLFVRPASFAWARAGAWLGQGGGGGSEEIDDEMLADKWSGFGLPAGSRGKSQGSGAVAAAKSG